MDELPHENIECIPDRNKYIISSSAYDEFLIVLQQKPNKNDTSMIDFINNIKTNFTISISLYNDKNIEALEVAGKNPNLIELIINQVNQKPSWQHIEKILKKNNIKILFLLNCYIDNDDQDKILPYLNKINNIKISGGDIAGNKLKKYLDNCHNVKNLSITFPE